LDLRVNSYKLEVIGEEEMEQGDTRSETRGVRGRCFGCLRRGVSVAERKDRLLGAGLSLFFYGFTETLNDRNTDALSDGGGGGA